MKKQFLVEPTRRFIKSTLYKIGALPERSFAGKISREAELSDVLKILELSNVRFNVEGRKIFVE